MLVARVARGLAAAMIVAALVIGVPVLLVALAGNPLPESLAALTAMLTSPDLGGVVLMGTLVPCAAWLAWGYLMWCLVTEGLRLARDGVRLPRPTQTRDPVRRACSALLSAIALMLLGSAIAAPASAAVPAQPTAVVAEAPAMHAGHALTDGATGASAVAGVGEAEGWMPRSTDLGTAASLGEAPTTRDDAPVEVTVREGDSLWSIAETYLGSGSRYPEIVDLNRGVAQADGAALSDDLWLTPGWVLVLPEAATPPDGAGATVEVRAGDTLWGLAEEHLGDGSRYDELAAASDISDPAALRPGDLVTIPDGGTRPGPSTDEDAGDSGDAEDGDADGSGAGSAPPVPEVPAVPTSSAPTSPPDAVAATDAATEVEDTEPARGDGHVEEPGAVSVGTGAAGASPDAPNAASSDEAGIDLAAAPIDLRTVGGIGGTLAAGLIGWLGVRRLLQRRARTFGTRIAMPEENEQRFEQVLRAVDATSVALHLDHALCTLAAWAQDSGEAMPALSVVRARPEVIALYLDEAAELPHPFALAADDGSAWSVRPDALPPLDRVPSPPSPTLVGLGSDATGALLFVDLERIGVLHVDGESPLVRAALMAMAIELATSSWAEAARLTLVGFDEQLTEQLSTGRVRHLDDVTALIEELQTRRHAVEADLATLDVDSVAEARTAGPDAEAWLADVVLVAGGVSDDTVASLDELARRIPGVGLACVVANGSTGSTGGTGGWRLRITSDDDARLLLPGGEGELRVRPQLVSMSEYGQLVELARITARDGVPAFGGDDTDWTLSLDPGAVGDEETGNDVAGTDEVDDGWTSDGVAGPPTPRSDAVSVPPILVAPGQLGDAANEDADTAHRTDAGHDAPRSDADGRWERVLAELQPTIDEAREGLAAPVNVTSQPTTRAGRRAAARNEVPLDTDARALLQSLADRPWVQLLGPVKLHNAGGSPPVTPQTNTVNNSAVNRATELVAYLALHPGASTEQVHAAFWPGRDPRGKTAASSRNGLATRARKWLGSSPTGEPYFPHVGSGGYRVHPDVVTDWQVFLALVGDSLTTAPTPRLRAALDLVHGQPFTGVKERFYGWAEVVRMDMLATIGDACHELAARSLRTGDVAMARTSAALGREIDPINETSWRDAMQAELLAGDHDGFERVVAQLRQHLDDFEDGYEPEPETQAVIDEGRVAADGRVREGAAS